MADPNTTTTASLRAGDALPVPAGATEVMVAPRSTASEREGEALSFAETTTTSVRERVLEEVDADPATSEDKFHDTFGDKGVSQDDVLIEDFRCALQKEILVQGRLYVSEQNLSFKANIFGWETMVVTPWTDIKSIEKANTAIVIPNAIEVTLQSSAKYFFTSFLRRDDAFDLVLTVWRHASPATAPSKEALADDGSTEDGDAKSVLSFKDDSGHSKRHRFKLAFLSGGNGKTPAEKVRDDARANDMPTSGGHVPTTYEGDEFKHVAMDVVVPTSPELAYGLMFTDIEFLKEFLEGKEKVKELDIGDWSTDEAPTRDMHYIKPLNGSIGPKETLCNIEDVQEKADGESYFTTVTTTHTPNVPSGDNFAVKTRTVITWSNGGGAHIRVTTEVDWKKVNIVLRGIIERSALDGQKNYHADLEEAMRAKISSDSATFAVAGTSKDEQIEPSPAPSALLYDFFDLPSTPLLVLSAVIVFLLFTNFWTLIALRHQARAAHQLRIGTPGEVAEKVRRALGAFEAAHNVGTGGNSVGSELEEVREIAKGLEKGVRELVDRLMGL